MARGEKKDGDNSDLGCVEKNDVTGSCSCVRRYGDWVCVGDVDDDEAVMKITLITQTFCACLKRKSNRRIVAKRWM